MPIQRIESLTYGIANIPLGVRYFDDLGFEKIEQGNNGASFRTPANQFIHQFKICRYSAGADILIVIPYWPKR